MIKHWLQLIRFPNLIIIALTQCLMQYLLLQPILKQNHLNLVLKPSVFIQLVLLFVLAGAGGYIINDIKDRIIDSINKPDKLIIGNKIAISLAQNTYLIILIISTLIALNLSTLFLKSLIIGFILNGLLWLYAYYLKQSVLFGNLTVAFLCAFTPAVLYWIEIDNMRQLKVQNFQAYQLLSFVFLTYVCMAFLTTLFREIVKDMEDVEGDKKGGCTTLPIVYGMDKAKKGAFGVGIALLMAVLTMIGHIERFGCQLYLLITVFLPMLYALYFLQKATTKIEFSCLSKISKGIMITGLCYIFWFI
jgi:4-hydroxybenzoate polyprenyltransferase